MYNKDSFLRSKLYIAVIKNIVEVDYFSFEYNSIYKNILLKMANRITCYVCGNTFLPRGMILLAPIEDDNYLDIVAFRRNETGLPEAPVIANTRACLNCNIGIRREINALQQNPDALRLNILSQYLPF